MTGPPVTAAIMQPTYLPYLGYFHLIAASDVFVFLDDVQFARRSWQSRNRILAAGGELMLSVPVRKHPREALIHQILISDVDAWRQTHLASIRHAYAHRPAFAEGFSFMEQQLADTPAGLSAFTSGLIQAAAARLGLPARFVQASGLAVGGHRSEHLLGLCRAVGATRYLSPAGSADYMNEDDVFATAGFPVRFQGFVEVAYDQGRAPFTPFMGFIDAVMNLGWAGTRALIDQMGPG